MKYYRYQRDEDERYPRDYYSRRTGSLSSSDDSSSPLHGLTKRRKHHDSSSFSSSSDFSSNDMDESGCGTPFPKERSYLQANAAKFTSAVVGRKLNLLKECKLLERDCQFVKKIVDDPVVQKSLKDKPAYLTGDKLTANKPPSTDPRIPCQIYLEKSHTNSLFRPVIFDWDENSRGLPPPKELLVTGLAVSIISKALLVNLIEAASNSELASSIRDIQLSPSTALLSVTDPASSVKLAKVLDRKIVGANEWRVRFDAGGKEFRSLARQSKPEMPNFAPSPKRTGKASSLTAREPVLQCSKRMPCAVIDYMHVPKEEPRRVIEEIFRKCRIYNVERGEKEWHLHLMSQNELDFARRWRGEFKWNDQQIPFTIRDFETPPRSFDFKEEILMRSEKPDLSREEHRPGSTRTEIQSKFDDLYKPVQMANLDIPMGVETWPSEAVGEDLSSLPIFNRRYLERKKAEENAAAQLAEDARVALEQKIQTEMVRRRERRERRFEKKRHSRPLMITRPIDGGEFELPLLAKHESGSARTQGLYKQQPSQKIVYLEDVTSLQEPIYDPVAATAFKPSSATSRSNRALNRRIQSSLESISSDLFTKATAFTARKKKLILGRSSIHSWGLFAGEDIELGDMVVEYVGEIIRYSVANVRERKYELALRAKGSVEIASSYFFRLDDDLVVDATHKGNLSRFVNHSCDPTCIARAMTIDGTRRIIMYARTDIRKGEELTYDYKFPLEEDPKKKIKCLCGTRNCRGTLN